MRDLIRAFLTVFPAELPDKSMVATIVLVARYRRPLAVWAGASAAFAVHIVVAVVAGSAIGLLPDAVVGIAAAVLFAVGAVVLFRSARSAEAASEIEAQAAVAAADRAERAEHERAEHERVDHALHDGAMPAAVGAGPAGAPVPVAAEHRAHRAVAGAFGLIILAEWGDLTQLATASLAARSDSPVLTGIGAYLALVSVAAIAATVGRQVVARVPLHRINYFGAAVFAALAVWSVSEVVTA